MSAVAGAGLCERVAVRRVAVDRAHALLAQLANGVDVQLDDGRLEAVLTQQPGHGASGRSVADDDRAVRRIDAATAGIGLGLRRRERSSDAGEARGCAQRPAGRSA